MGVIFGLLPLLVLGGIIWAVVGAFRRGSGEPLTLATATAFYANLMVLAGILAALVGIGDAIKVGLAAINLGYSYSVFNGPQGACPGPVEKCGVGPPAGYLDQQRNQDLVLSITLILVGVAVLVGHQFLYRFIRGMRGGSPLWIVRGRWIALTAVCGLIGLGSAAAAIYTTLSYLVLSGPGSKQPFGDSLGIAIAFLPAWVFAVVRLLRAVRLGNSSDPSRQPPPQST